MHDVD